MKKKLLSILLCLCMVVTLLPTMALAVDPSVWAVENGIVSGSNGALMPTNPATRGQVAAIVMRYAQSAEK